MSESVIRVSRIGTDSLFPDNYIIICINGLTLYPEYNNREYRPNNCTGTLKWSQQGSRAQSMRLPQPVMSSRHHLYPASSAVPSPGSYDCPQLRRGASSYGIYDFCAASQYLSGHNKTSLTSTAIHRRRSLNMSTETGMSKRSRTGGVLLISPSRGPVIPSKDRNIRSESAVYSTNKKTLVTF